MRDWGENLPNDAVFFTNKEHLENHRRIHLIAIPTTIRRAKRKLQERRTKEAIRRLQITCDFMLRNDEKSWMINYKLLEAVKIKSLAFSIGPNIILCL
jgi:hypothetical protein